MHTSPCICTSNVAKYLIDNIHPSLRSPEPHNLVEMVEYVIITSSFLVHKHQQNAYQRQEISPLHCI